MIALKCRRPKAAATRSPANASPTRRVVRDCQGGSLALSNSPTHRTAGYPKNSRQPDRKNLCFREHRSWRQRHRSNRDCNRTRSNTPTRRRGHPVEFAAMHLPLCKMTPLWRCHAPRIARHAASGHTNDYDWENQSRDRRRSTRRWSTTRIGIGISEPSLLNRRRSSRSTATTIRPWICLSDMMRSANGLSMRRRRLNWYLRLIRSTSLTRSHALH